MFIFLCCFVLSCNFILAAFGDGTTVGIHNSIKCVNNDREALLQFKRGINHDHCGLLSSWGSQEDCCQWRGISCSNHTGHVTVLHLRGREYCRCLEGKVDSSLFELKHLKYLDLSMNIFSQNIPKSIDSLTHLKHLNLSNAGFFGHFPAQLGNLSKLEYLDLKCDHSCFNYPTNLQWLSHLKLLKYIDLSFVDLSIATNWVQIINNLPFLEALHMDWCHVPPIIPQPLSYINSSTGLRVVSLSNNALSDSSVFQWLFNLSGISNQFEHLDLSSNALSGPLPSVFGKFMHSLSHLFLSCNQFESPIPEYFTNQGFLEVLDLAHNNFVESLPKVIQTLSYNGSANKPVLESLYLNDNQFWGSVPKTISSFSLMRELYLDGNQLNGTISEGIGQLSMLEKLGISNNSLEVTLTHIHFLKLSRLRELNLSDNPALVISINKTWIPPFQLDIISLRSCRLGPYFPKWITTQTNISYLDISNAQISGYIPSAFWAESLLLNLEYLNMSHNQIHGLLPDLSKSFRIFVIDLSSNYFEGPIHAFLGAHDSKLNPHDSTRFLCPKIKRSLEFLDLSNNKLSGELPDCWMKIDRLTSLHLEHNLISGIIPASIGALKGLRYLHLMSNRFSGVIPASLENCTSLVILDLAYNSLTGNISSSIGHAFKDLAILNLRGNNFIGKLPFSLCQLSKLQVLHLGYNHISGIIPKCIHNLTAMMTTKWSNNATFSQFFSSPDQAKFHFLYAESEDLESKGYWLQFPRGTLRVIKAIDLSSNELEGEIPNEISNLIGLYSLDLSRNRFTGSIPSHIGQLTSLESLDLSNNQLFGQIPIGLERLFSLEILNLSNNNLSGKIPTGHQLDTFDSSWFMGNPLLCGAPLKDCTLDGDNISQMGFEHDNHDIYARLCITVVLGFIVGFCGVCGTLVFRRSWRDASFRFFDNIKDKSYVMVIMNAARTWRKP